MLRSYLKIAWRNLWRQKGYTFINIAGLTMGLVCCLLIFQYVAFEYSFDRFHENEDSLYRVTQALARSGDVLKPSPAPLINNEQPLATLHFENVYLGHMNTSALYVTMI